MVPSVHNSSIPLCRHIDSKCSFYIWHLVWFDQLPIRVCTVAVHLVNFPKVARVTPFDQPWHPHRYEWAPWKRTKSVKCYLIMLNISGDIGLWTWQGLQNFSKLVKFPKNARVTLFDQPRHPHRYEWAPWKRAKSVKCYLIMLNISRDIGLWTWQGLQNFSKLPHITVL